MILLASSTGMIDTDGDNFTRLHVDANGLTLNLVVELIVEDPTLALDADGEHLWVDIARLERAAESVAAEHWREGFRNMVSFATEKGWTSDDGNRVRAHLRNLG